MKPESEEKKRRKSALPSAAKPARRSATPKKSVLAAIAAPTPASAKAGVDLDEVRRSTELEKSDLDNEKKRIENAANRFGIQERAHNLAERKHYAGRTFWLVASWICAVFLLLLAQGLGSSYRYFHFHLSDTILAAAIGSTTFNVIGMLLIILRGLFSEPKK